MAQGYTKTPPQEESDRADAQPTPHDSDGSSASPAQEDGETIDPTSPHHPQYKSFLAKFHANLNVLFQRLPHIFRATWTIGRRRQVYRLWSRLMVETCNRTHGKNSYDKGTPLQGHGGIDIKEMLVLDPRNDYESELPNGIPELQRIARMCGQLADRCRITR